jgi:hypothetical protein
VAKVDAPPLPAMSASQGSAVGSNATGRAWEIDALRGLMLVLMTATHLPTRFASALGQPFGYVSAARFVLLSGFMAGRVYMQQHQRDGEIEMRAAFLKRPLYEWLAELARVRVPPVGRSFSIAAWQFLWVIGLWMVRRKSPGRK